MMEVSRRETYILCTSWLKDPVLFSEEALIAFLKEDTFEFKSILLYAMCDSGFVLSSTVLEVLLTLFHSTPLSSSELLFGITSLLYEGGESAKVALEGSLSLVEDEKREQVLDFISFFDEF